MSQQSVNKPIEQAQTNDSMRLKNEKTMKWLALLTMILVSLSASAQALQTGEWAVQFDGVTPAVIGQPTTDHLFTVNSYSDAATGAATDYVDQVSFQGGSPQVVAFWLDDTQIYGRRAVQALTPVAYGSAGIPYSEMTYGMAQFDLYLPAQMKLITYRFDGELRKKQYAPGGRMPYDTYVEWSEKPNTLTIDGHEYRAFTVVIMSLKAYGYHFSGNELSYAKRGAMKKDDAPLFYLAIENSSQAVAQGRLPDMIIANQEFVIREAITAGWLPNDYRFFFGTGGNNVEQRFQYYHRVDLYGSLGMNVIMGDANGDGLVDVYDVVVLVAHVLGNSSYEINLTNSDLNQDNILDVMDVIELINHVLGKD